MTQMTARQIQWLGEVTAKSANRAIRNGDRAGTDQNRGQFVEMVKDALNTIPESDRGVETKAFLAQYSNGAFMPPD